MASKRNLRRKACDGKICYHTLSEAKLVRYHLLRKEHRAGQHVQLDIYKCPWHSGPSHVIYHIGHHPGHGISLQGIRKAQSGFKVPSRDSYIAPPLARRDELMREKQELTQ